MKYYRNTGEHTKVRVADNVIKEYISSAQILIINDVLVDIDMFRSQKWTCKPEKCTFNLKDGKLGTCCDGGGIISPEYERLVSCHLSDIKKHLSKKKIEKLHNEGMHLLPYQMNELEDECIFLSCSNNIRYCSLHRVTIEKRIPTFSLKSFDCCIEPLEIIVLEDNRLFLTLATKQTVKFVRWGNVLGCIEKPFDDAPLVVDSVKEVLIYIFGYDFYNKLSIECHSKSL